MLVVFRRSSKSSFRKYLSSLPLIDCVFVVVVFADDLDFVVVDVVVVVGADESVTVFACDMVRSGDGRRGRRFG